MSKSNITPEGGVGYLDSVVAIVLEDSVQMILRFGKFAISFRGSSAFRIAEDFLDELVVDH